MKKVIFLATSVFVVISLLISGFVISSASIVQASVGDWQKGGSIQPGYATDFLSDAFHQSVLNLKSTGANYVTLIVPYYQTNTSTTDIGPGGNTPSDSTIVAAINFIHSQGMKVMLKPHLESYTGEWRANINPTDRDTWFKNYGNLLNNLATLATQTHTEEFCLGAELISMSTATSNPDNTARWVTMINNVRSRYTGLLTYSANWGISGFAEEVAHIGFWSSLDTIGISAYYELTADSSNSVQSLMSSWDNWNNNRIKPLHDTYNKPILFTEIGYKSVDNAHIQPWNYSMSGNANPTEQANDYQALFQYWNNQPYFAGLQLWNWSSDPNAGNTSDTEYTPQHKPAQDVMRTWFTQNTPPPVPTPAPTGTINASASVSGTPQVNQQVTLPVQITTTGQAQDVLADIEIYNSAGTKMYQKYFDHQNISNSSSGQYTINWTPQNSDTYTLKVGVFTNDWSKNYYWGDSVVKFSTNSSQPAPQPQPNPQPNPNPQPSVDTNIWWPTDGSSVTGVQPFKAMLTNKSVSDYQMFWQVDGGHLNQMNNSNQDYPHKESLVDLTGWNWKSAGPYSINFVSKDASGTVISQKAVSIYVK